MTWWLVTASLKSAIASQTQPLADQLLRASTSVFFLPQLTSLGCAEVSHEVQSCLSTSPLCELYPCIAVLFLFLIFRLVHAFISIWWLQCLRTSPFTVADSFGHPEHSWRTPLQTWAHAERWFGSWDLLRYVHPPLCTGFRTLLSCVGFKEEVPSEWR